MEFNKQYIGTFESMEYGSGSASPQNYIMWPEKDGQHKVHYGKNQNGDYEIVRLEDPDGNDVTDQQDMIIGDHEGLLSMIKHKEGEFEDECNKLAKAAADKFSGAGKAGQDNITIIAVGGRGESDAKTGTTSGINT